MGNRALSDGGMAVGAGGWKFITDTQTHTGPFGMIVVKDAAVINTIDVDGSNGAAVAGETFTDKSVIGGTINSIKLTSGKVFAYYVKTNN